MSGSFGIWGWDNGNNNSNDGRNVIGAFNPLFGTSNTEILFNNNGNIDGDSRLTFSQSRGSLQCGRFMSLPTGNASVVFGQECDATGSAYCFAGGWRSTASAQNTFSYGSQNAVSGENSACVGGFNNTVSGTMDLATGSSNNITGDRNFVSGTSNTCSGDFNLVSGEQNENSTDYSITGGILNENGGGGRTLCIGRENVITNGANSIIGGYRNTQNEGDGHNLMVGLENTAGANSGRGIIGGRDNDITGTNCIVSGFQNTVSGGGSITQGDGNNNSGANSICVGLDNVCTSENGVCLGQQNNCTGFQSICLGRQSSTQNGNYGIAIGRTAQTGASECIAIGRIANSSPVGSCVSISACNSSNPRISHSGTEKIFLYGRNAGNYNGAVEIVAGPDIALKTTTVKEHGNELSWSYTPTTSGDWNTVPDNVGDALDTLASIGVSEAYTVDDPNDWNFVSLTPAPTTFSDGLDRLANALINVYSDNDVFPQFRHGTISSPTITHNLNGLSNAVMRYTVVGNIVQFSFSATVGEQNVGLATVDVDIPFARVSNFSASSDIIGTATLIVPGGTPESSGQVAELTALTTVQEFRIRFNKQTSHASRLLSVSGQYTLI